MLVGGGGRWLLPRFGRSHRLRWIAARRFLVRPLGRDVDEQGLTALDVGGGLQEARNRHERQEEEQVKEGRRDDGEDQGTLRTIPRKPGPHPPWQALHRINYGTPSQPSPGGPEPLGLTALLTKCVRLVTPRGPREPTPTVSRNLCPLFQVLASWRHLARHWKALGVQHHGNPDESPRRLRRPAPRGRARSWPAGRARLRRAQSAEPGPHRGAMESDPALLEHGRRHPAAAPDGPHRPGDGRDDGAGRFRLRVHQPQLPVRLRRGAVQGPRPLGGRAHSRGHRGAGRQLHSPPARAPRQARVFPLLRRVRGLRGATRRAQARGSSGRGGLRRQSGRHARAAQGQAGRGGRGQLALPRPVRRARARGVPRDLRLGGIPGPRGHRAPPGARRHRRAGAARAARHGRRSGRGADPDPDQVQGLRAGDRSRLRGRAPHLPLDRPVRNSLRTLLLGLNSVAIVSVTLGGLAVNLRERSTAAQVRLAEQTERLAAAAGPLLLDSLVVGDLARAEQTVRNLNTESVWSQIRLYESDGRRVIFDASPQKVRRSHAPRWLKQLVAVTLAEHRVVISATPVTYGVLAVTPSVESLENELWTEVRTMIAVTGVLLVTLLGLTHVILLVGLRPVRALAESATRLGHGDLTARMPETKLSEMRPTVRAFNSMAASLEQALHEAHTRQTRLESLVEISGDLSRMQPLDSLLGRIAEACGRIVKTDRKSTRLNSSHGYISYAVFCLKKKKKT